MTTFALSILKLIQQSRPGTHEPGTHQISYAYPNSADAFQIGESFAAYEKYMRGAAKLIAAPSSPTCKVTERENRICQMVCDLYSFRRKLSRQSVLVVARLICPEYVFRRAAFRKMMRERLRRITCRARGVVIKWDDASDTFRLEARRGNLKKVTVVSLRNNEMLRSDFNCVGAMYEAFTKAFQRTEKTLIDALNQGSIWPDPLEIDVIDVTDAQLVCRKISSHISSLEYLPELRTSEVLELADH